MSAFMPTSRALPGAAEVTPNRRPNGLWLWLLVAALLLAYLSPLVVGPGAALSFGGYDLAEWASLPPDVRTQNPPLVTSFLLRVPLTLLTLFIAFAAPYRRFTAGWLLTGVVVLALVAAQLPPLEYFSVARNDPNYAQQAALAVISLVGAALPLMTQPRAWRSLLGALFAALGAVTVVAGVLSAQALLAAYQIEAVASAAASMTVTLFVVAAVASAIVFVRAVDVPREM